ncbi:MAG: hypothetical protein GY870_12530 [archaeon]|nr:hypothetical protein [archaeon]
MLTIAEKSKIELSDEYYEDKCLYGDVWDRDRSHACQILAMKCNDELNSINDGNKKYKIRQKIVDEAGISQYPNSDDIVEVNGGKPFKIWSRDYTIFEETYDTNNYIDKLKNDKKFGKCSIALYGVETQFWKQVSEGLFQNQDNATALRNIEGLIFDDKTTYTYYPKDIHFIKINEWLLNNKNVNYEKRSAAEAKKLSYFIDIFGETEAPFKVKYNDASFFIPQELEKIYDYLVLSNEIEKTDFAVDVINASIPVRLCNDVHNPYVTDGKYRFCSSAYTNGKGQSFEIYKQIPQTEASKSLYTIPEYIKTEKGYLPQLIKARDYNKKLDDKWKEELKKHDKDSVEYHHWKNKLKDSEFIQKSFNEAIERAKKEKLKIQWQETSVLGCWHNFYDLIPKEYYPEYIRGKYQEVENAVMVGEITEKQATKLLEDIGQLEKEFNDTLKLHKPISYQPTRMRLYGSQIAIHGLINDNMCRVPLEDVFVDDITKSNVRKGFLGINLRQLVEHKIYTQEDINKMLAELARLDVHDILSKMAETRTAIDVAGESLIDSIHEEFANNYSDNLNNDEQDALEIIFGDLGEFMSHDMIQYTYTPINDVFDVQVAGVTPLRIWETDTNDEREIEIEDVDQWIDMAAEAFPSVPSDMILAKFRDFTDEYLYIKPEVTIYAWVDYGNLRDAVNESIEFLEEDNDEQLLDSLIEYYREENLPKTEQAIIQFYNETIKASCRNVEECRELASRNLNNIARMKEYLNDKADDVDLNAPYDNISNDVDEYITSFLISSKGWMIDNMLLYI